MENQLYNKGWVSWNITPHIDTINIAKQSLNYESKDFHITINMLKIELKNGYDFITSITYWCCIIKSYDKLLQAKFFGEKFNKLLLDI